MSRRVFVWHRWFPPKRGAVERLERVAEWRRTVATRFAVAGGKAIATAGGSVAASFATTELVDVIDVLLDLLAEAEQDDALEISFGCGVGEVLEDEEGPLSDALEMAQLLSNRCRAGELVLDPGAREAASDEFLFGRQVTAGAGLPRGTIIDRQNPRRDNCAEAIEALQSPPLPPIMGALRDEVIDTLAAGTARAFVFRGPVGAGATEVITALAQKTAPEGGQSQRRIWRFGAAPGGVVPLASLRLSLLRRFGSSDAVGEAIDGASGAVLARVARGELVPLDELADVLAIQLRDPGQGSLRPWVVLSPLSLVDGATLAALLEARARGGDFVLFGRLGMDGALPRPLVETDEPIRELTLPPLKMADARVVSEAVLGHKTDDDVARRVAVLGGDTVLGVVEAARTLVASGDLVLGPEGGFVWRAGPRDGALAIGTEAAMSERLETLDPDTRRVLETLCVVPDGWPRAMVEKVAGLDGVSAGPRFERSMQNLTREALARGDRRPRPASSLLRWRVLSLIPPSRSMELHRFVGEALEARAEGSVALRVQLGFYLVEGGLEERGRPTVLEGIEPLIAAGYERTARQLSGWLGTVGVRANDAPGRATPVPPPLESHEEGPPSSDISLDELLEEAAVSVAPPRELPPVKRQGPAAKERSPEILPAPVAAARDESTTSSAEMAAEFDRLMSEAPPELLPAATEDPFHEAARESFDEFEELDDDDLELEELPPSIPPPPSQFEAIPLALDEDDDEPEAAPVESREFSAVELELEEDAEAPATAVGDVAAASVDEPVDDAAASAADGEPPSIDPPAHDSADDAALAGLLDSIEASTVMALEPEPPTSSETQVFSALELAEAEGAPTLDALVTEPDPDLFARPPSRAAEESSPPAAPDALDADFDSLLGAPISGDAEPQRFAEEPTSVAPAPMRPAAGAVVQALLDRDYAALEAAMDRAVAEGSDLGAVGRVRAVAELTRGDLEAARRSLAEAKERGRDDGAAHARTHLAGALLALRSGEPGDAIREALLALAASRELSDARGELAARYALAECYRALGRSEDAARLQPT